MSHLGRHTTASGPRWACDGRLLPESLTLDVLLALPAAPVRVLAELRPGGEIDPGDSLLAPLEPFHEVWACGVNSHLEPTNTVVTR